MTVRTYQHLTYELHVSSCYQHNMITATTKWGYGGLGYSLLFLSMIFHRLFVYSQSYVAS